MVLTERENGLSKIRIQSWDGKKMLLPSYRGETYTLYTSTNVDFNTTKLRYSFNSLTTPSSALEYDMATGEEKVLKQQEVLGTFDKSDYTSSTLVG